MLSLWLLRIYTVWLFNIAEDGRNKAKRKKLGKRSKSLRWKLLALKMSLWNMHFLYAVSFFFRLFWAVQRSNRKTFALPSSPCGFSFHLSRPDSQVFADLRTSINNLAGNVYLCSSLGGFEDAPEKSFSIWLLSLQRILSSL